MEVASFYALMWNIYEGPNIKNIAIKDTIKPQCFSEMAD